MNEYGGFTGMILITGFEPFNNDTVNPSYEAVKLLKDEINGEKIIKLELPVVFYEAADILIKNILTYEPKAVIMTGVAAGRNFITPEVIAVNIADARIPDNKENKPPFQKISATSPDGLFSTLPVNEIVKSMNDAGLDAQLSYSAGTFVCNDTFYRVMDFLKTNSLHIPCGFIHVPNPKGMPQGADMDMDNLARGLRIAIETVIEASM